MKIISINGSPNAEKGTTNIMTREFLQGAQEGWAETETVYLAKHNIKHCSGCASCWVKSPGKCIIKDDMAELYEKFYAADVAVLATPLWIDTVSSYMKIFMDRVFMPILDPRMDRDPEHGECRHLLNRSRRPKLVVMATCGFPEQSHFQAMRVLFRRVARNFNLELAAEIYRGGGGILLSKGTGLEAAADEYKQLLRKAGREFVEMGCLSGETKSKLEEPVLPGPDYVDQYVQTFERVFLG